MFKYIENGTMMGGRDAVEFFATLGTILDDIDIADSVDSDFSEKFTIAVNRVRYLVDKDTPIPPKKINKIHGGGILSMNCGNCGSKLSEPHWKFCPNCGYTIAK